MIHVTPKFLLTLSKLGERMADIEIYSRRSDMSDGTCLQLVQDNIVAARKELAEALLQAFHEERPFIRTEFLAAMQREIGANQYKGDWRTSRIPLTDAVRWLVEHTTKLEHALMKSDRAGVTEHSADVALCAMKIEESYGVSGVRSEQFAYELGLQHARRGEKIESNPFRSGTPEYEKFRESFNAFFDE